MAISTDALRMQLELEVLGAGVALDAIQRVSAAAKTANAESKAEALAMQRMAVEGKYNPDIQRDYEIEKAIKLTNELNLSLQAQDAILTEIANKHANSFGRLDQNVNTTRQLVREEEAADNERVAALRSSIQQRFSLEDQANNERVQANQQVTRQIVLEEDTASNERINNLRRDIQLRLALENELNDTRVRQNIQTSQQLAKEQVDNDQIRIASLRNDIQQRYADAAATQKAERIKQDAIRASDRAWADSNSRRLEAMRQRFTNERNTIRMGDPGIVPLVNFNTVMTDNNRVRRQAIALMRSYSDITQIAADDTAFFNAALANGSMTAADHARAIDGVNRRMRSMAGGAGNLGYVVGNVMTGLEDFTTVLSITGFGMDGFAAATRSASNNVGQAVRGFGTATAAMLAPMVSIGMVLVGFAIPAAYRWVTGAEDSAKATEKWRMELEKLQRIMTVVSNEALLKFDRQMTENDIKKMFDADKLKDDASTATDAVKRLELELNNLADKHRATGMNALDQVMPQESIDKFNKQVDFIGRALGGDVEKDLRDRMKSIRETFITEVSTLGGAEAQENFKKNIDNIINEMNRLRINGIKDPNTDQRLYDIGSEFKRDINARIAEAKDELAKIDKSNTLAESAKREEIKTMEEKKKLLEEQLALAQKMKDVREEGERFAESINNRAELENDLEMLKIQNTKNRLLGDQFEAERRILDLSLRRREIMESGLAAPAVLEGMFNAELEAIAADITAKLAKLQDITVKTGMEGEAQAYTDTNRQIMEASKDQKVEEKEMIELLKAIREHLAGGNMIEMKVM